MLLLEGAQQVVGDGADVAVAAARGHDHGVGHGRLAAQVDGDDVLRLVVLETIQNELVQRTVFAFDWGDRLIFPGGVGNGVGLRVMRGRGGQRSAPGGLLKRKP